MRIAFLTSIYSRHLERIYEKHKRLEYQTYEKQFATQQVETICSMGKWPHQFEKSGIPTLMVCRNNIFLQERWCMENDYCPKSDDAEFEVVAEQVLRFKPTILYVFGASYYAQKSRLQTILSQCPSIKKKVSWYGAPEGNERIFKSYDLVLTNSFHLRDSLRKLNIHAEQINHAFEPKTLEYIKTKEKNNRIGFFGTTNKDIETHKYRTGLLEKLAQGLSIDIYTDIEKQSNAILFKYNILQARHYISNKLPKFAKSIFPRIYYWADMKNFPSIPEGYSATLRRSVKSPIYGLEMYESLSTYLISFNGHISHTGEYACNLRLFEATGLGSCLLTDHLKGIDSLFEVDYEVVTYKCPEEAIEKADFLLNNHKEAISIGKAAQKKTLERYNTKEQVNKVIKHILE